MPQLTTAQLPGGLSEGPLRTQLLQEHGIEVGGGLGSGKGKLWRIGLMGSGAVQGNVQRLLGAVDSVLARAAA